ncbi:unnamed protein product [Caenorhabditis auriculariae]|uniref:Potassium channel domain-containing protein n=1 Tax=Caenorhabditis auriculariae TaxID=2777116 RepID=A0A8S1HHU7_9PELO|nr:unnamed protein product [Caenorhabditis auriculariae]
MTLLYPLRLLSERIENLNEEMLERLKSSAVRMAVVARSPVFIRWSPLLMLLLLAVYLLCGATGFFLLESEPHEMLVRKWYMNLAVERRQFAKSISSRIFNDTRNLLIIIDREQTARVQQLLVESLKGYEEKLEIVPPSRREWTFFSCFNYAYGLLLTLGNGVKVPSAVGSQIFAVVFSFFGIPLFYSTLFIVVYRLVSPILKSPSMTIRRRLFLLQLLVVLYILWSFLLALCLYYQVINDFWNSLFVAFTTSMTIQVPSPAKVSACGVLFLQLACTISAALVLLMLLVIAATYFPHQVLPPVEATPFDKSEKLMIPPRFAVVVDQAGESHLSSQ